MSDYKQIKEVCASYALTVVPNGRVRYPLFVYRLTDLQTPVVVEDVNLTNAKDRAAVLAQLPDECRTDVDATLLRLAAGVAAERLTASAGARPTADRPAVSDEPWPEPVDGGILLDSLVAMLARYMVLPQHAATAIALWIVHTYLLDAAEFTPYLWVSSPVRECGKSTLLELLRPLAFRAQLTGGISGPALYRKIDRLAPTMLLDELDTRLVGDGGENLRGVLNTGFQRSGCITICVGDAHEDKDFKTFCPKVLAGIGRLWDTVESRSLPVRLRRATKDELRSLKKIRGTRIDGECQPYRRQLLTLAAAIRAEVTEADPDAPEQLGARHTDVWTPLLAIADAVGGGWAARARTAAIALHSAGQDEGDVGLLMLEDVRQLFQDGFAVEGRLPSAVIVEELVRREDRPWPEYHRGQPITAAGIAKLMKRFDVKPKVVRLGHGSGSATGRAYELAVLAPIFEAYLPTPGFAVTGVTGAVSSGENRSVTPVTQNPGMARDSLCEPGSDEETRLLERMATERQG